MERFDSHYYPYKKVIQGANTLRGIEVLPYQLLTYLLDLPDSNGYQPVDDNLRPRVRLVKYLWHDGANPLSKPLPTVEEKMSMLFDPENPDITTDEEKANHPKGYRLYWQKWFGQSQTDAQTTIKCFIGNVYERTKFVTQVGIRFEILSNTNLETNLKVNAYQRTFDIEQCLHEALDGVNITGAGTISFATYEHSDNGSGILYDEGTNVGRFIHCSIPWSENEETGEHFII